MALQNFFCSSDNGKRAKPSTISGKEVTCEFRMKKNGSSVPIVEIFGSDNKDGTITTRVIVRSSDGRIVLNQVFTTNNK